MYFIIQHDTALTYRVLILKIIISGRAHSLGRNQGFRRHRFLSRPWWKTLPDKIQINVSQSPVHWNLGSMMAKVIRGNLWWWNFSTLKEMVGLHPLFILFCFLVWRWVPWSTIHSLTLPSDSPSKVMKVMHRPGHGPESLKWLNKTFIYFLTVLSRVFFCSNGKVASTLAPSSFRLLSWSNFAVVYLALPCLVPRHSLGISLDNPTKIKDSHDVWTFFSSATSLTSATTWTYFPTVKHIIWHLADNG